MELLVVIIALATLTVGWGGWKAAQGGIQARRRMTIFTELGITRLGPTHFSHSVGGVPVLIEDLREGFRFIVGWPPPAGLSLTSGRSPRPLGDPDFDRDVTPKGSRAAVLAYLSADTRRALATAIRRGWQLTHNGIERRIDEVDAESFAELIAPARAAALAMPRRRRTLVEGLLDRLETDPIGDVRQLALDKLLECAEADDEDIAAALELARRDPDTRIRMVAARRLDEPMLFTTIALTNDAPPHLRAEALVTLLTRHATHFATNDLVQRVTRAAAGEPQPGLSRPAVVAMLSALGPTLNQPATQRLVLAALDGDEESTLAAIDALEFGGGLWAVPHLVSLRDRRSSSKVGAAARRIIPIIQARAGGELGALALAPEGGELTLAEH